MRELGDDTNCVTHTRTDRRTQPFIVKDSLRGDKFVSNSIMCLTEYFLSDPGQTPSSQGRVLFAVRMVF